MRDINIDEIYTFKLSSGEELIARVVEIDQTDVIVTNPLSLVQMRPGFGPVRLMPSMQTADSNKSVNIKIASINMHSPTIDALKARYADTIAKLATENKTAIIG